MNLRAATQTTHLGRYQVVKRLAAGGMADVLLARTDGIAGFERHVVIKRIHAALLDEPRYVKMFLDEARLAASLHHHNIVQVNDIGEENGEYFFAMEYVHGEDARTLLVEASKREARIPIEHVVTIITAAAAGLHHAHEQRNVDGSPLNIVHRDVSPANILIGYDGAVKVADFGIALASHRSEQTQSGVLKGKVAYMSPEQCNCEIVDRRSDVFSLGIVLYELATVRPCFAGDNDFMTMSAIVNGKLEKPSVYRADIPPGLEAIIMKSLARNVAERYQSADELRLALEQFANEVGLRTSTTALADYMKTKFGAKALPWQADDDEPEISVSNGNEVRSLGTPTPRRDRTPPRPTLPLRPPPDDHDLELPMSAMPGTAAPANDDDDLSVPVANIKYPRAESQPFHSTSKVTPAEAVVGLPEPAAAPRSRRMWLAGSIAAVVIAGLSLVLVSGGSSKPAARASTGAVERQAVPQPLAPSTVTHEAGEAPQAVAPAAAPTETAAPAPAKKPRKAIKKSETKSDSKAAAKKWDPDALFPH